MLKMKWFLLLSLAVLASCQKKSAPLEVLNEPLIRGIAPAIFLDLERTVIPLQQYVSDVGRIDSVTFDGVFNYDIDDSNLLLLGRPKKPLYRATLWTEGVGESLLLKRTKRTLHSFLYQGKVNGVKIRGDFNGWDENKTILKRKGEVFTTYILLDPGRYEYQFLVDGEKTLDPYCRISVANDEGGRNSVINISGSDSSKFPAVELLAFDDGVAKLRSSKSIVEAYAFWNNTLIPDSQLVIEGLDMRLVIPENAFEMENSLVRIWIEGADFASNEMRIDLNYGKMSTDILN